MAFYSYVATDLSGKIVKGREQADSHQELIELLREKNLFCSESKLIIEKQQRVRFKYKTGQLAVFCRQLSAMLSSGINLVRALHILMTQEENKKAKEVLRDIYEELQRGRSFSEALETKPGVFPDLFVGMMAAGEVSGNMDMIVDRVSDHYAKENKLKNTVKKSLTYPIILGVLMLLVVFALFGFVLPMFTSMFPEDAEMPGLTVFMLSISDFVTEKWYVLIVSAFVLVLGIRMFMRVPKVKLFLDKLKCTIPKVGKLVRTIYTARFARTMANLFASGMQMVECIEKSVGTLNNAYLTESFKKVLDDVKRGESLSTAIAKLGIFEGMFTSTIYIGEESGRLDFVLAKSADYYDEEADSALARLVSMIEPIMIIVMGGAVTLVLASILPMMYGSFAGITG